MAHDDKSNYIKVDNVGMAFNDSFDGEGYIEGTGRNGEHIGSDGYDCEVGGIEGSLLVGCYRRNFGAVCC